MGILSATDWRVVARVDGSMFIECGQPHGDYHMAFDVGLFADSVIDTAIAERICSVLNSDAASPTP